MKVCNLLILKGNNLHAQIDPSKIIISKPVLISIPGVKPRLVATVVETSFVVSENNEMYGWGYNRFGIQCRGTFEDITVPEKINFNFGQIKSLHGAWFRVFILSDTGLYVCGQLNSVNMTAIPLRINIPSTHAITHVGDSRDFTMVTTAGNEVFCFGVTSPDAPCPYNIPKQLNTSLLQGESIAKLTVGIYHAHILTKSGKLYGFGYNSFGELGCSTYTVGQFCRADKLENLGGTIVDVATLTYKTFVIVSTPGFNLAAAIAVPVVLISVMLIVAAIITGVAICKYRAARYMNFVKVNDEALSQMLMREDSKNSDDFNIDIDKSIFEIKFETFKDLQEIGSGGSGAIGMYICAMKFTNLVYKAKMNSTWVAIKLFRITATSSSEKVSKFELEVKMLMYEQMSMCSNTLLGTCDTRMY